MTQNIKYLDPETHDYVLNTDGKVQRTSDLTNIVVQRIKVALQVFMGEWFLNRDQGVPFFQEILKANPDISQVRNLLFSEVSRVQDVDEILEFNISFDSTTRIFGTTFKVRASDGTIIQETI